MRNGAGRAYAMVAIIAAFVAAVAVFATGKHALHLAINRIGDPRWDALFAYGTHLADGWMAVGIGLVFLFIRWRWFLLLACSVAGSALITQFLKHTFFSDADRPFMALAQMPGLRLVPGVEMLHHNSFPSGHSTCAFSLCAVLALVSGKRWVGAGLAALAVLLALSRVYLSQHYTEDVLCGGVIGLGTTWLVQRWLYESPFATKPWLDKAWVPWRSRRHQ